MAFALGYAEVFHLLASAHDIPKERHVALRGRLQHLQKLRFPAGVNTGRGRAAAYGAGQVLMLMLAFDLTQLGLTPDRAANLLSEHHATVAEASHMALMLWEEESVFFVLDPVALASGKTFFISARLSEVHETLDRSASLSKITRLALINLSGILKLVASWIYDSQAGSIGSFRDGILEWKGTEEGRDVDPEA